MITEKQINDLLTHTTSVINHVFWFQHEFDLLPVKDHLGASIRYNDISCRKDDFLKELINTISSWVYSKQKAKEIIDSKLKERGDDIANASSFLTTLAFNKFRPGFPQGQFGELLLFNLLQYFYKAVPILRKMRITTSVGHERYGADAIHFKIENNKNIFILGESKCYESKYKFKNAFNISIESIIDTFNNFNTELDQYVYDDFIEKDLIDVIDCYKSGTLNDVHFELLCLIAYNETNSIQGDIVSEIEQSIKSIIIDRCTSIEKAVFQNISGRILDRINYIIFPIWELDLLLNEFSANIGKR